MPLKVLHTIEIPDRELTYEFTRSPGPGGQNVNKVATQVTVCYDLAASAVLTDHQKAVIGRKLAGRINKAGVLRITSRKHRSQSANRQAAELREKGARVFTHACDIRDHEAVGRMVDACTEQLGRIDGLVNNAAGNFLCPSEDLTPGGFDAVVKIVLYGTFHCTQAVGKQMMRQATGGSILSIITPYAWTGSAYVMPSAAAKAGVLAMTRSLAVEWARQCPVNADGVWQALEIRAYAGEEDFGEAYTPEIREREAAMTEQLQAKQS